MTHKGQKMEKDDNFMKDAARLQEELTKLIESIHQAKDINFSFGIYAEAARFFLIMIDGVEKSNLNSRASTITLALTLHQIVTAIKNAEQQES
jgi:hypothetical protein